MADRAELLAGLWEPHPQTRGALGEARHMLAQRERHATIDSRDLIDAVAEIETAVLGADAAFLRRAERAVDVHHL